MAIILAERGETERARALLARQVLGKLNYASWTSWPKSETRAIRQFVSAWRGSLAANQRESRENWQLDELESALVESDYDAEGAD